MLITVDLSTLQTSRIDIVVYMNGSLCDHLVCLLPTEVNTRDVNGYWLLGVGGSPITDEDGVWGFEWLPQLLLETSFTDLNISGVKTSKMVSKEDYGKPPMSTIPEDIPYIAGILASSMDTNSFCTGVLITKRLVLTAAHCIERGTIRYVALTAINYPNKKEYGEIIRVSHAIVRHSCSVKTSAKGRTYSNNVMLIQLEHASSRTPIRLINETLKTMGDAVKNAKTDFGLIIQPKRTETLRMTTFPIVQGKDAYNRLMNVSTLPTDNSVICVGGKDYNACPKEPSHGGNPLVYMRGTPHEWLLGISSSGLACIPGMQYSAYTRILASNPFLKKYMNQPPLLLTSSPRPAKAS